MNLIIVSIILTLLSALVLIILVRTGIKMRKLKVSHYSLAALALLIIPVFLFFGSITKVNANEVGIIFDDRKGVLEDVKYEGFQFKSIFEHITCISTANKTQILEVAGQANDSAYATFIITVIYQIEAKNAGLFYRRTSATDLSQNELNSNVKEALQSTTSKFDIYSILGDKLEEVRLDFVKNLKQIMLDRYHITLVSASFDDVDGGAKIENIIQNKAEALQEVEIAEAQKLKAEVEAQTMKIRAEAEAEVARIKADASSYGVEVEKKVVLQLIEDTYEANKVNLTYEKCAEIVLNILFIQNWDGKLPEVLTSDSLSSLIGALISGD